MPPESHTAYWGHFPLSPTDFLFKPPTDYTDYHGFNFIIWMMNDFFDEILSLT